MNEPLQINKDLILLIKEQILKEPMQFMMHDYFAVRLGPLNRIYGFGIPTNCGTAACIAGWAVVLGRGFATPKAAKDSCYVDPKQDAMELLGLTEEQAEILFYTTAWPVDFQAKWIDAQTYEERAQIAADRIDHFLQENQ
jgi:hypothetical protein